MCRRSVDIRKECLQVSTVRVSCLTLSGKTGKEERDTETEGTTRTESEGVSSQVENGERNGQTLDKQPDGRIL